MPIAEALARAAWARRTTRPARRGWGRRAIRRAVVGPDLRVHGFDNLRVADTSIYPDNVMHNTNLTALVVGERAAGFVAGLAQDRVGGR